MKVLKILMAGLILFGCNTIAYKEDPENHYQTTAETRALGTGDCEDMALVKYWDAIDEGKDAKLIWLRRKANPFDKPSHIVTEIEGNWYSNNRRVGRAAYELYHQKWYVYMEITKDGAYRDGIKTDMPNDWKRYFIRELIDRLPAKELTTERLSQYDIH